MSEHIEPGALRAEGLGKAYGDLVALGGIYARLCEYSFIERPEAVESRR